MTVGYDKSGALSEVTDSSRLFLNKEPEGCPITKCTLMKKGCSETAVSTNLVISEEDSVFKIKGKSDVLNGYAEDVCVICENKEVKEQYDGLEVSQPTHCTISLENAEAQLGNQELSYADSGPANLGSSGWKSFFKNTDETNCPLVECQLQKQGCKEKYDGSNIQISTSAPYQLTATTNAILGYKETICYTCKTGHASIQKDNFEVS